MNRSSVDQERKTIEADGMLRQRRSRRENKELPSDFTLLVPSVLQGLALREQGPPPVAQSHHHPSQMLGGADSLLTFPRLRREPAVDTEATLGT